MRVSRAKRAAIVFDTYKDGKLFSHRIVGEMFGISPSAARDIILKMRRELPEGFRVETSAGMGLRETPGDKTRRSMHGPRPGGHRIVSDELC